MGAVILVVLVGHYSTTSTSCTIYFTTTCFGPF